MDWERSWLRGLVLSISVWGGGGVAVGGGCWEARDLRWDGGGSFKNNGNRDGGCRNAERAGDGESRRKKGSKKGLKKGKGRKGKGASLLCSITLTLALTDSYSYSC